ncbi:DUF4267 domain-containing protein [Rhodotorula paludigena]|uniref:DUF4267 domain-containing protein n=1 Tax=Rhodotorula paludigena TaxID=86838 RepID=UPI0031701DB0
MPRSFLVSVAGLSGLIPFLFGINAMLRPAHALTFFNLPYTTSVADRAVLDGLLFIYGARDIFMGCALFATSLYNARKPTGWILLATAAVGGADGLMCKMVGTGEEWSHWGYAPVLALPALALLR